MCIRDRYGTDKNEAAQICGCGLQSICVYIYIFGSYYFAADFYRKYVIKHTPVLSYWELRNEECYETCETGGCL